MGVINNIVIYRHIRPDKNEPFYIGIGRKRRAYSKNSRTNYWKNINSINNDNIEVDILEEELSWEEAATKEKWWISFYGRKDLGKGPLVNLTDGGEGAYGKILSNAQIEKFKNTMSKRVHPMKGKHHTPEAKAKIAEAGKMRICKKETGEKISATKLANGKYTVGSDIWLAYNKTKKGKSTKNSVKVINSLTGDIYDNISAAAQSIGMRMWTLRRKLYGERKNETSFKLLNNI